MEVEDDEQRRVVHEQGNPLPDASSNRDDEDLENSAHQDSVNGDLVQAPRGPLRVEDIERELGLTAKQGRDLHNVVKEKMKEAGILGKLNFRTVTDAQRSQQMEDIVAATVSDLGFLLNHNLQTARVAELVVERARILNSNEKHNEYMVRVHKVHARAGAPKLPTAPNAAIQKPIVSSRPATNNASPVSTAPNENARKSSVPNKSSGSIHIPSQAMVTARTAARYRADNVGPTSPPPTFRTDMFLAKTFYPSAFLVQVTSSNIGAVVRPSQLDVDHRHGTPIFMENIDYGMFIDIVSRQVGFNVEGRISAVVQSTSDIPPVPTDVLVKLTSEEWMAVMQIWTNAEKDTCEFVVEAEVDDQE